MIAQQGKKKKKLFILTKFKRDKQNVFLVWTHNFQCLALGAGKVIANLRAVLAGNWDKGNNGPSEEGVSVAQNVDVNAQQIIHMNRHFTNFNQRKKNND